MGRVGKKLLEPEELISMIALFVSFSSSVFSFLSFVFPFRWRGQEARWADGWTEGDARASDERAQHCSSVQQRARRERGSGGRLVQRQGILRRSGSPALRPPGGWRGGVACNLRTTRPGGPGSPSTLADSDSLPWSDDASTLRPSTHRRFGPSTHRHLVAKHLQCEKLLLLPRPLPSVIIHHRHHLSSEEPHVCAPCHLRHSGGVPPSSPPLA
jgi:hypothetical protein